MDSILEESLNQAQDHIKVLDSCMKEYFDLEAIESSLESELYLGASIGKTVDEKKAIARSSAKYRDFKKELATAKRKYLIASKMQELLKSRFDAELNTYKIENSMIKRQL